MQAPARLGQQAGRLAGGLARALQAVEGGADLRGAGGGLPQVARVLAAVAAPAQLVKGRTPRPSFRGDEALARQRPQVARAQAEPGEAVRGRGRAGGVR
jgi:hypothetical protein